MGRLLQVNNMSKVMPATRAVFSKALKLQASAIRGCGSTQLAPSMEARVQTAKDQGMNPLRANGYQFLHSRMSTSQGQLNVEAALASRSAELRRARAAYFCEVEDALQGSTITVTLAPTRSFQ